jgi:hypothetical protein
VAAGDVLPDPGCGPAAYRIEPMVVVMSVSVVFRASVSCTRS